MEYLYSALYLAVIVLIVFYFIYVQLVRKKNAVNEAYSGIDVQLCKRHDLIPNVVAVAQKFMTHEKNLLEEIVKLRNEAMQNPHPKSAKDISEVIKKEDLISGKLGELKISMENYPTLKSDSTMIQVQESLRDVEENLAAARRFYNSAVRILNDSVLVFPMSYVAKIIKIEAYPYFEAKEAEKKTIDINKMMA